MESLQVQFLVEKTLRWKRFILNNLTSLTQDITILLSLKGILTSTHEHGGQQLKLVPEKILLCQLT